MVLIVPTFGQYAKEVVTHWSFWLLIVLAYPATAGVSWLVGQFIHDEFWHTTVAIFIISVPAFMAGRWVGELAVGRYEAKVRAGEEG